MVLSPFVTETGSWSHPVLPGSVGIPQEAWVQSLVFVLYSSSAKDHCLTACLVQKQYQQGLLEEGVVVRYH